MKNLVASAVLALSVLVCLCASAQQRLSAELPSAASATIAEVTPPIVPTSASPAIIPAATPATIPATADLLQRTPAATEAMLVLTPTPAPIGVAAAPEVPRRKLIDKKFVGLGVLVFGTTSLDMELTQHCLQRNQCVELNPTLPTSHWGMYATNTPVNLGVMWLARKRRAGGHWDWWLWPAIDAGIHVYGVTTNYKYAWGGR
jgi:hypothetical protein